jgi:hypothetical protein
MRLAGALVYATSRRIGAYLDEGGQAPDISDVAVPGTRRAQE